MGYLVWPRRNRFAVNPVGAAEGYVLPASARVVLDLLSLVLDPTPAASQLSPAPQAGADSENLLSLVQDPAVLVEVYGKKPSAVTVSIASPAVFTYAAHGFANGQKVRFSTTGALPTGLTAGADYFVINQAANTFQVSAVAGGAAVATTGTQSGVHSLFFNL
jgi:hypothetical protein